MTPGRIYFKRLTVKGNKKKIVHNSIKSLASHPVRYLKISQLSKEMNSSSANEQPSRKVFELRLREK